MGLQCRLHTFLLIRGSVHGRPLSSGDRPGTWRIQVFYQGSFGEPRVSLLLTTCSCTWSDLWGAEAGVLSALGGSGRRWAWWQWWEPKWNPARWGGSPPGAPAGRWYTWRLHRVEDTVRMVKRLNVSDKDSKGLRSCSLCCMFLGKIGDFWVFYYTTMINMFNCMDGHIQSYPFHHRTKLC